MRPAETRFRMGVSIFRQPLCFKALQASAGCRRSSTNVGRLANLPIFIALI